jgi:hypothetical protein
MKQSKRAQRLTCLVALMMIGAAGLVWFIVTSPVWAPIKEYGFQKVQDWGAEGKAYSGDIGIWRSWNVTSGEDKRDLKFSPRGVVLPEKRVTDTA